MESGGRAGIEQPMAFRPTEGRRLEGVWLPARWCLCEGERYCISRAVEKTGCPPLNTSPHIFVGIGSYDDGTKESFARSNVTVPVL